MINNHLGEIGDVGKLGGNFFGHLQILKQAGAAIPGAIEKLALGARLDLQRNRCAGAGGGGCGNVQSKFAIRVGLDGILKLCAGFMISGKTRDGKGDAVSIKISE